MTSLHLSARQRASWLAHAFKSITQNHHDDLIPLISPLIARDAIVIDVGAHAGQYARLFARLARDGHVHAFEPASYARSILELAVKLRGVRNVTVRNYALGDNEGELRMATPLKRKGKSYGYGLTHVDPDASGPDVAVEAVRATTLDRFVAEEHIARVNFIKCDIEGWEGRFIAGAADTLARFHPALLLELNAEHLKRGGDSGESVFAQLMALGYRAGIVRGDRVEPVTAYIEPGDYVFQHA